MAVSITGTIQDASGNGVSSVVVRLSPSPADEGASASQGGIGIISTPVEVLTDGTGAFTHTAIESFRYRLEIPSIGYDRQFVAPATAVSVQFHLLGLLPKVETVSRGETRVDATTDVFTTEVTVLVESVNTVMERFDQVVVSRSGLITGPFAPVATMDLLSDTNFYEFDDNTALADQEYFYRALYQNSGTAETTEASSIVSSEGQGESALLISIDELKGNYLFGADLSDDDGNPFPDRMFEHYIRAGIDWLEKELDIPLVAHTIADEVHDHFSKDYGRWGYFQLQQYPVLAINQVTFQYPTMNQAVVIDPTWVILEEGGAHGVIQIVPGQGNIADVLLIPGALMPMWSGSTGRVPGIWHFNYRVGFEPLTAPPDLKHVVGMWASIGILNIAGDLIAGAGIANKSVSIPGLSQNIGTTSSATNSGYGARIIEYQKEIKEMLPNLRRYYGKTTRMVVV